MTIHSFARILFIFMGISFLTACTGSTSNPLSSEGQNIVDAPLFSESRLFFLKPEDTVDESTFKLVAQHLPIETTEARIAANSPITVSVESVTLPRFSKDLANGSSSIGNDPMDILVIVDVGTKEDGSSNSLAVWYERNVLPGRSLDFENLIIHNEPRWDPRVSPYFRLRVLDMKLEKNQIMQNLLSEVQKSSSAIGTLLPYPGAAPILGIAGKVASLALGNQKNRPIIDYTFQLHSSQVKGAAGANTLGEIRKGSFMAIGLEKGTDRDYWKTATDLSYNALSRDVGGASASTLHTPIVKINIATAETVVPKIIVQRTLALSKMFQDLAGSTRPESISQEMENLSSSISAFVLSENVRRFKRYFDVQQLHDRIKTPTNLASEDIFYMVRAMGAATGQKFESAEAAIAWWKANKATFGR